MAHAYAHLFALPCTGLRFFTVYGPWGRPDMAPMLFADAISEGRPIRLFNAGRHSRDFTYVDDIAEGVVRAADVVATPDPAWDPAAPDPGTSAAPFRIYNIGNGAPVELARLHRRARARRSGAGRSASPCRCSPATCPTPGPTAPGSRPRPAGARRPRSTRASRRFVAWYRDFYRPVTGLARAPACVAGRAPACVRAAAGRRSRPGGAMAMGRSAGEHRGRAVRGGGAGAGRLPAALRAGGDRRGGAGRAACRWPARAPAARPEHAGARRGGARRGGAAAGLPRPLPPPRGDPLRHHRQRLDRRDAARCSPPSRTSSSTPPTGRSPASRAGSTR